MSNCHPSYPPPSYSDILLSATSLGAENVFDNMKKEFREAMEEASRTSIWKFEIVEEKLDALKKKVSKARTNTCKCKVSIL